MSSPREVVDRVGGRFPLPDDAFDRLARRRDRRRRNQRIRAGCLALLIVLAAASAFARAVVFEEVPADQTRPPTPPPAEPTGPVSIDWDAVPGVSIDGDAIVDIRTGEVTPLPASITSVRDRWGDAVAPGGEVLLFEASAGGSSDHQIFVANVDGTNVRQLTDAPGGAFSGAWSPDGTQIVAILGRGGGPRSEEVDLALIDVATGETTHLATGVVGNPRFVSGGRIILFVRLDKGPRDDVFGIPVGGGEATLVYEDLPIDTRYSAEFSPDGRMIAYGKSVSVGNTGGLEIWLADADGSNPRPLVPNDEPFSDNPSWSPDGTRIVFTKWRISADEVVAVVDVESGTPAFTVHTPQPAAGTWLDDHTLLVNVGAFS